MDLLLRSICGVRDTVCELALGSSWASDTRSFGGTIKRCATDGAAVLMMTSLSNSFVIFCHSWTLLPGLLSLHGLMNLHGPNPPVTAAVGMQHRLEHATGGEGHTEMRLFMANVLRAYQVKGDNFRRVFLLNLRGIISDPAS